MPQGQGEPAPVAHYPTPGLRLLNTLPKLGIRAIKQATTGQIYAVAAEGVYLIDPTTWAGTHLGDIMLGRSTPVSMQDNGTDLVIVDGSGGGWYVHLADNSFHKITDPITSTDAEASRAAVAANIVTYTPFTAAATGPINSLTVNTYTSGAHCKAAIYSGDFSVAEATSAEVASNASGSITFTFGTPYKATKGSNLFVAIDQDASVTYGMAAGTGASSGNTAYSSFPFAPANGLASHLPVAINSAPEVSRVAIAANNVIYLPFVALTSSPINTVTVNTYTAGAHIRVAIYNSDFSIVRATSSDATSVAGGTITLTFPTPYTPSIGENLVGAISQDASVTYGMTSGTGWSGNTAYPSFPVVHPNKLTTGQTPIAVTSLVVQPDMSAWYGADRVDYLDTYLLFNKPNTPQFYSSDSLALTFDPLWFANKEAFSDLLRTLAVVKREIWLFGERTTEIFANVGAPDFPFQAVPSTFIDHGIVAKYSVAVYDNSVFWLSYDRAGKGIVLQGAGYQTKRVSTFAIEHTISEYDTINDAIGFTYQLAGHTFYVLTFPKADATWVYDVSTSLWHEWVWLDTNGREHRHRANCCYPCNGVVVCGDWENGNLYELTLDEYTDNGAPIKRLRAWPHMINQSDRVFYRQFVADMETGWTSVAIDEKELIRTSFTATDGTLLQLYSNPDDVGAWTMVSGMAQIVGDQLVGSGIYQSNADLTTADYVVRFSVIPSDYTTVPAAASTFIIARATDTTHGYRVAISADGTQYSLTLTVLGTSRAWSIALGTIPSGRFNVVATFRGGAIILQCQRSWDGRWLRADGVWTDEADAIAIIVTDTQYTTPGLVFIGSS